MVGDTITGLIALATVYYAVRFLWFSRWANRRKLWVTAERAHLPSSFDATPSARNVLLRPLTWDARELSTDPESHDRLRDWWDSVAPGDLS